MFIPSCLALITANSNCPGIRPNCISVSADKLAISDINSVVISKPGTACSIAVEILT